MERTDTRKEHNQHSSVFSVRITSMIFIFLSSREKAHDNKEFSCENLTPCHESRIMTPHVMRQQWSKFSRNKSKNH